MNYKATQLKVHYSFFVTPNTIYFFGQIQFRILALDRILPPGFHQQFRLSQTDGILTLGTLRKGVKWFMKPRMFVNKNLIYNKTFFTNNYISLKYDHEKKTKTNYPSTFQSVL